MKLIKNLVPYLIIILVVVLVRQFIVTPVRVNGTSMYPTLDGGEIMLLNKLEKIDRFDIVVLKTKKNTDNLIKRVIGLPGETIEIANNKIYIDNHELKDDYGYGTTYDVEKVTLKDDEYYVLGDNRVVSMDSRVYGTIKKSEIKGVTNFIMYPFKKFGRLSKK